MDSVFRLARKSSPCRYTRNSTNGYQRRCFQKEWKYISHLLRFDGQCGTPVQGEYCVKSKICRKIDPEGGAPAGSARGGLQLRDVTALHV
jgi:hypothetical protein